MELAWCPGRGNAIAQTRTQFSLLGNQGRGSGKTTPVKNIWAVQEETEKRRKIADDLLLETCTRGETRYFTESSTEILAFKLMYSRIYN